MIQTFSDDNDKCEGNNKLLSLINQSQKTMKHKLLLYLLVRLSFCVDRDLSGDLI